MKFIEKMFEDVNKLKIIFSKIKNHILKSLLKQHIVI